MAKVSVIGICGNSVFMNVDHFHEKGETLVADSVYEEIGGKGINQAITCAKMGAEVSFLGAIGEDEYGTECRDTAKKYGVNGFFAVKKGEKTTFAVILTNKSGENQVTGFHGAELTKNDVFEFENEIKNSDVLLLQQEVSIEVNNAAVSIAKKHNVKIILNPAPIRDITDTIAKAVFAVTPNEQEKQAIDFSRFENCITTLGDKGCDINGKTHIEALKVNAVDTTGAGDVFNGVLAVLTAEGMPIEAACKYAVCASGMSVTKPYVLNSIPTREETERKMAHE